MLPLTIAAAVLAGLTVLVLVLALQRAIAGRSNVDARLDVYTTTNLPFDQIESSNVLTERANAYINRQPFADGIAASLGRAGVKLTVSEWVLIKIGAMLLPLTIFLALGYLLLGVLLGAIGLVVPELWLRRHERQRQRDFVLQLPETLAMLVSGLRAGFSLQQAIVNVSKEANEPTASEFQRLTQEIQLGVPLLQAFDGLVRRIKSDDLDMIVSVFKIHQRVGGNLATVLETVGTTIRERVKLRREIQVITAMQRISAYILGGLPWIVGGMIFLINPSYMLEIFQWNIFLCLPIMAFILGVTGFLVIRRMANIKI